MTQALTIVAGIEAKPNCFDLLKTWPIKRSAPRVETKIACRMIGIRTMAVRIFLYSTKAGKAVTCDRPAWVVGTLKPALRL